MGSQYRREDYKSTDYKYHQPVQPMETDPAYVTPGGAAYHGNSLNLIPELEDESVNLAITSPPFALQRKKEYGNKEQGEYVDWLLQFGELMFDKLAENGSFVIDLGGAYKKGVPARSLYNFRVPIRFYDELDYILAEDFYWHNPSKLPGPIEWVNKRKLRAKDSVNTVWWFSKDEFPKADVSNVLTEYSDRMKKLLDDPDSYYDADGDKRPSGHDVGSGFAKDNGGAIPSNLLEIPNSESNSHYLNGCKAIDVDRHPARFPSDLPRFFIEFLTDPDDLVVDIFAGSNTTGSVSESLDRNWIAFDNRIDYLAASSFRFLSGDVGEKTMKSLYDEIKGGESVDLEDYISQGDLFAQQ